jgi:hypothetical protein
MTRHATRLIPARARAQTAIATPQLSVLVDALTAANLTGGSLADPFAVQTVFAPTNAAFAKLTAALGTTASQLFTRKARGGVAARAQGACARADKSHGAMRCGSFLRRICSPRCSSITWCPARRCALARSATTSAW